MNTAESSTPRVAEFSQSHVSKTKIMGQVYGEIFYTMDAKRG